MAEEDKSDKLTINKKFAAKYLKKKEHEEKSILRDKYGDDVDLTSSSSSEEEDEAPAKTLERDFLLTLSLLKSKDPAIYDTDKVFFTKGDEVLPSNKNTTPSEPMHLKDYERKRLLEKGSMAGVSDSEDEDNAISQPFTYSEEQQELKESFKSAAVEWGGANEDGEFLVVRHKTKEEKDEEDHDFVGWLKGGGLEVAKGIVKDLGHLKDYWSNPTLDEGEKFLRDYILNRGYLDTTDQHRIPTYNELVASDAESSSSLPSDSEDEEALDEQETFERRYNFRFEEPDGNLIKSYPRTLSGVVRREDDKRKIKRKERMENKLKEKEVRKEDLGRLRNLREKEMREKLKKLASITGNPVESFGLTSEDIEADFDPESYDKAMQNAFSEEYYEGEDDDEEKPEFSDLEMEDEGLDGKNWKEIINSSDFNMDADYMLPEGGEEEEEEEGNKPRRRKKKRSNLNPDPESELMERHELEGRLKGELFSYREVEPVDFGLTTEEILCSDNKELNKWVSLTKAVQYLTPEEEEGEKRRHKKKARDWKKKKSILNSFYGDAVEDGDKGEASGHVTDKGGHVTKKRKGTTNKHKKLKGKNLSEARLKSYGI